MSAAAAAGQRGSGAVVGRSATVTVCLAVMASAAATQQPTCAPDNAGISVPDGFCVVIVAEGLGGARHLTVAPNGDVLVAVPGRDSGGVVLLRDTDNDGIADLRRMLVSDPQAADVQLYGASGRTWLYYSTHQDVIRVPWRVGATAVEGMPDTVVRGLVYQGEHGIKTFVIAPDGRLFVNVGAPSNSCQRQDRQKGSVGWDPCPLLDSAGGIWLFDANRLGQTSTLSTRYATGMRNTVALSVRPTDGELYAVVHGRDQLAALWGYSDSASAEKPAEEFVKVTKGTDVGWPYCYYDPQLKRKVLSPEYGGDGTAVGRCANKTMPIIGFPAHWAPDGLLFYTGAQFPAAYRGGAFVAFHGSWNRAPLPQQGYNLVFVDLTGDHPGEWRVFADGFQAARSRPVDVAQAPDGSIFVSDDRGGRVFRILYRGARD
jgi:glucose/arabinose dehydrogenase